MKSFTLFVSLSFQRPLLRRARWAAELPLRDFKLWLLPPWLLPSLQHSSFGFFHVTPQLPSVLVVHVFQLDIEAAGEDHPKDLYEGDAAADRPEDNQVTTQFLFELVDATLEE